MDMILKGREQNCSLNRCILSEIDYPVWGKQNAYLFDGSSSFRAKNVEYMRSERLSSKLHRTRLYQSPNVVLVRIDRSEATPLVRRASQVIRVCSCSPHNGGCGFPEEYGWYHILVMSRQRSKKYSATFGRAMLAVLVAIEAPARYYRRFMAMRIQICWGMPIIGSA